MQNYFDRLLFTSSCCTGSNRFASNRMKAATVPNATTSIVPGWTDRVTTVRPVATSTIDITMTGPNNFFNRLRRADGSAATIDLANGGGFVQVPPSASSNWMPKRVRCWPTGRH